MASNKWMRLGSVVAIVGWLLLLAGWLVPSHLPAAAALVPPWPVASVIGACAICSGFAIALLATLAHGFGALDRFFIAALERSAARAEAPPMMAEPAPQPPSQRVIDHGIIDDSVYRIYGDGSVEVETLLGNRRFASLQEAQDFVGIR